MTQVKGRSRRRHCLDGQNSKMHARTERLQTGVRLATCIFILMSCSAFMVATLPHKRKLEKLKLSLAEVHAAEQEVVDREDAKRREHRAIDTNPSYRELIARDRLNYYKPGEQVIRIQR